VQLALHVTDRGAFRYEFYLPLEEIGRWLPCVSAVRRSSF
jgi:hypothetical protein